MRKVKLQKAKQCPSGHMAVVISTQSPRLFHIPCSANNNKSVE